MPGPERRIGRVPPERAASACELKNEVAPRFDESFAIDAVWLRSFRLLLEPVERQRVEEDERRRFRVIDAFDHPRLGASGEPAREEGHTVARERVRFVAVVGRQWTGVA